MTLSAKAVPIDFMLMRLGEAAGFEVELREAIGEEVTLEVDRQPLQAFLASLLRRRSYALVFEPVSGEARAARLTSLIILGENAAPEDYREEIAFENTPAAAQRDAGLAEVAELAERSDPLADNGLIALSATAPHMHVRRAATRALAGRKGDLVRDALLAALRDPSHWVRREAARSIGGVPGPEVARELAFMADHDPDATLRRLAAGLLELRGPENDTKP